MGKYDQSSDGSLAGLSREEQLYKKYFLSKPELWREPIFDWQEMVERYHKAGIREIPKQALSVMGEVLTEENIFTADEKEVRCFYNMRFCPPFTHILEFIKIVYVRRGSVVIYLNEIQHILTSGSFCIITPGIRHSVFSYHDEDEVVNVLMKASSFAGTFSGILLEQNILSDFFWKILYTKHSNRMLMFCGENDQRLDRLIDKLREESGLENEASSLLLESYVMIFLGIVMRDHLDRLKTVEKLTDEVYMLPAIIRTIRENLRSITIQELSVKFQMKEYECKHYIVRESGYTFSYLLKDFRLRKAAELLRNSGWSMERIAEEVGYSNMTNFYHSFREYFGKTPQEFRLREDGILI